MAPKGSKNALGNKGGRAKTIPEEWDERIKAIQEYAQKEDSYSIYGFAHQYMKADSTVKGWCHENSKFSEAYESAKEIVGERRYTKGLKGEFNSSLAEKTHPIYNNDYREWRKYLKEKEAEKSQEIHVHVPSFDKKEEKE